MPETVTTGQIPFKYGDDDLYTWYKVIGDLDSGVRPLVILHGGPGLSHHYMLPHVYLAEHYKIPVIFYDQIGNGQSSHLPDKPKEYWTLNLLMDQLDNLLNHFGIRNDFDLLGNSWGGMFAGHYAAYRPHPGMKHLVIANAGASVDTILEQMNRLLDALPPEVKNTVRKHEREGTVHTQEYEDAMMVFNYKHRCTVKPWPKEFLQSIAAAKEDPTVRLAMIGPCDFTMSGTLKNWTIVDRIQNIVSSTLLINSPTDTAQDACVLPFFRKIPKVRWVRLTESSHLPAFEEPEKYFEVVASFLLEM